ncbi:hypothetical protein B7494_g642 [Chlorociboria aeruginascens]|nr:hypothetical protein B7494_g642 [Chlorociboria aeruginascens]
MSNLDQLVKGAPPPGAHFPSPGPSPIISVDSPTAPSVPDPLASLPSSPPQIYLNLLILEASLRAQWLQLRTRRRQHTFFLTLLGLWILYFGDKGTSYRYVDQSVLGDSEKTTRTGGHHALPNIHEDDDESAGCEEDLSRGGDYIKLLLLPKPFSPNFRENWDIYRTEYWEKENERRAILRQKLKDHERKLAKQQGGWLWWTGYRGWKRGKGHDIEKTHPHVHRLTTVEKDQKRTRSGSFRSGSHSRNSSRSTTPPEIDDTTIGGHSRRSSTASNASDRRRKKPAASTRPQKLTPGSRSTTPDVHSPLAPSPPHIHVPPTPEDAQLRLPEYKGTVVGDQGQKEILKYILQKTQITAESKAVWKYELRRKAQQVLSFLYLGPSSAARDVDALKSEGITMLLVIRNTMTAQARMLSGNKPAKELGIEAATVDVAGNPELIAAFPQAIKAINNHLISNFQEQISRGVDIASASPGKILVFCESGNERSAVVVAAYIMAMYDLDLIGTIQFIQAQRFCVAFDDGLKNLLLNYQTILDAQKSLLPNIQPVELLRIGAKRGRDEVDEMDMDVNDIDDCARFEKRATFAPFAEKLAN